MILADTSVWIEHLRRASTRLTELLNDGEVVIHPFIIGELACGGLKRRYAVLNDLADLPRTICASHEETLSFIENHHLWGRGIGWIDVHLLASAVLSGCALWTLDVRLEHVARDAGVDVWRPN